MTLFTGSHPYTAIGADCERGLYCPVSGVILQSVTNINNLRVHNTLVMKNFQEYLLFYTIVWLQ